MYAVIKTGGKQQKVKAGDVIEVEKLVHEGETLTFAPLLVVEDDGKTHVGSEAAKATVTAKPLGEKKGDKIKIFKYRPKSGYAKRGGHRQLLTLLEIEDVSLGGGSKTEKKAAKKPAKRAAKGAEPTEAPAESEAAETSPTPSSTRLRPRSSWYPGGLMAHKKGGGSSRNGRDSNVETPRREGLRRRDGHRRLDHRAPARHPHPPRRGRGQGRRRHAVRPARGLGASSTSRADVRSPRSCPASDGSAPQGAIRRSMIASTHACDRRPSA